MDRREQILYWINDAVNSVLSDRQYKLFIFGSQANLKALKNSDIDIGIESAELLEDSLLTKIWSRLEDLPTLYTFDLIDFNRVDDNFKKIAKKNIELLHNGY